MGSVGLLGLLVLLVVCSLCYSLFSLSKSRVVGITLMNIKIDAKYIANETAQYWHKGR